MSRGLPAASFAAIRSEAEMKNALRPLFGSITPSTRRSQATQNRRPECPEEYRTRAGVSKTKEGAGLSEGFRSNSLKGRAERGKRAVNCFSVSRVCLDE